MVGDEAARGGPNDRAESEHRPEQSCCAAALRRREQVADNREHGREQDASEDALDTPEHDQLGHVLGQPAERGGDDEADHARQQERLTTEQVAEFAGDRRHGRRGHQVSGRHPRQPVEAVEVGHDPRDGRAHDRLVECGQQQRQHRAGGGEDDPPSR